MVSEALEDTISIEKKCLREPQDATKTQDSTPKMDKKSNNITFNSNGKLLLTGEYLVLDGALALAIPTKYGQSLEVESINERKVVWRSLDEKGGVWFEHVFSFEEISFPFLYEINIETYTNEISKTLLKILYNAIRMNQSFFSNYLDDYDDKGEKIDSKGFKITTKLDFPINWGLGTSSTLINNIAQWTNVDAFKLLEKTFGGSGYDIACAQYNKPITFKLLNDINEISRDARNDKKKSIKEINFNPSFKEHLYFVYLNKKQNSRDGIAHYKHNTSNLSKSISEINSITQKIISCKTFDTFIILIEKHENIISKIINQKPIKEQLFNDFNGGIKSLGAWGGDFILVASEENPETYFKDKGFKTIIPYRDMIL